MNKHTVLVLFLTVCFMYNVTCDEAQEVKRRGLARARQSYRYNHPPETENYETIPVAIVYDKVIDRSNRGRNIQRTKETERTTRKSATKINPEVTTSPKVQSGDKVTTEYSVNDTVIFEKDTKIPEPKELKLSYKIPVSVVYDEEPSSLKRNRIKSGVSTRLRKPIKKQENPNIESITQSEPTLNTNGGDSKLDRIIKKDSQIEKPIKEQSSLKQDDKNVQIEKPSKFVTTRNEIKGTSTNETEKKRMHGEPDPIVPIVASENRVFGHNGEFKYSYEGGDGTKAFSKGKLKTFDEEVAGEAVEGGFSYKDKDGNDISLSYTADENGYRPTGAHLPTPPPIPPAIARALAYLATKTTPEPVTEPYSDKENTPKPKK